jgi:cell division control protein 6
LYARTLSSLNSTKIGFKPYDAKQLYDILLDRARLALEKESYTTEIISYISAWVAKESGDARKAISILRLAANLADIEDSQRITIDHVNRAIEGYDLDAFVSIVETLTTHFKLIILALLKLQIDLGSETFVEIPRLFSEYIKLCDEYGLRPLSRDNFNKKIKQLETFLGDYLESYIKSFGKEGRKKVVRINLDSNKAKKVISQIYELL